MQPNIHDAFFKSILSRIEHAASFLRQVLPPALVARIDFTTLVLCTGSYVDEALKERHSDLLFSVSLDGRETLVYLLLEHQSSVDGRMSFRLLRYEMRIWEQWSRDYPDAAARLPMILPVVLHHSEKGWTGSTAFEDLIDADANVLAEVGPYVPRFRFLLVDISKETDEALRGRAMTALVRLCLWCLRHAREPEVLVDRLGAWMSLVREVLRAPDGMAAVVLIMRYILEASQPEKPDVLVTRLVAATFGETKEEIVTAGDVLVERGRKKGLEQGLTNGRRDVLLRLLRGRFRTVPKAAAARIQAADIAQLDRWLDQLLTAPTLADALADR